MKKIAFLISCVIALCAFANEPMTRVYKKVGDRELSLRIFNPPDWKASDQRPAIVFFHGGGWISGSPAQFSKQSLYLAGRGLVCITPEYRLIAKGDDGPPTEAVSDAKSAMRWVRTHAAELGIDPNRLGAGGGSAGGHLASFTTLVEGLDDPNDDPKVSPKANALVLFNPVFDNGPDQGWGYQRMKERYKEFSPAHHITSNAPPTIVMVGTKDALLPVAVVERFKANMEKVGVRCDVRLYEGQSHGFFNTEPSSAQTLEETDKFLTSLGWLKTQAN